MKHFGLLLLILGGLLGSPLHAQSYTTFKTTTPKAKKAYEAAGSALDRQDYAGAVEQLSKAIKQDAAFVDAYQDRASAQYYLKDYPAAITDYERALALAPDLDPRLYFYLGETQFKADRYADAQRNLDIYIDKAQGRRGKLLTTAEQLRGSAAFAAEAVQNPVPFKPEKLSAAINLPDRAEYLPVISVDGRQLIFTAVVRGDENFYISERDDATGEWLPAQELAGINTDHNEGAETISADGRTIVFTGCNRPGGKGSCDLYYSEQRDGRWTPPANIGSAINTRHWESLPALSADGNTLYFSSNRPGGLGGKDLYVSRRVRGGGWSIPENLGAPVNTKADDQSPFLHPDGRSLYFMSQGHPGMGGYDLYVARRTDSTWAAPENLGYPINTKNDEGALFITLDGRTAYFATDREYATGNNSSFSDPRGGEPTDIYRFELPASARPLPATYVKARVYDAVTKAPLTASVEFDNLTRGGTRSSTATRPDGTFLLTLPMESDYALSIEKEGYFFHSENFALSAEDADPDKPYLLEIGLRPLPAVATPATPPVSTPAAAPIVLRNVLFETASAELKPVSRTELNRLRDLLQSRPQMRIQLNGHTDNVGSDADNLALSKARARAVYDYLVREGIDAARLQSEGYGETRPIDTNDTVEGRRQNRRTEFVVL